MPTRGAINIYNISIYRNNAVMRIHTFLHFVIDNSLSIITKVSKYCPSYCLCCWLLRLGLIEVINFSPPPIAGTYQL